MNVYKFLRYTASAFLIFNSLHRICHPYTGVFYMPEEVFAMFGVSQTLIVYSVMIFSLVCSLLIILDKHTFYVSSVIAIGISLVVIMLLIQTPYLPILSNTNGMYFFDVAMRDFGVASLFIALSIIAKQHKDS